MPASRAMRELKLCSCFSCRITASILLRMRPRSLTPVSDTITVATHLQGVDGVRG